MTKLWHNISTCGVTKDMQVEIRRKLILLNQLSIIVFVLLSVSNFAYLLFESDATIGSYTIITFLAIATILTVPYMNKKGFYRYTSVIFVISVPVLTLFFSVHSQVLSPRVQITHYYLPRFLLLAQLVLPLILVDSKNKVFLFISLFINIACLVGFDFTVKYLGVPFDYIATDYSSYKDVNFTIIFPALIIILGFSFLNNINRKYEQKILKLNGELKDSNEELKAQQEVILEKNDLLQKAKNKIELINKDLTDSINYAERIQRAILEEETLPKGYFADSFVFFKPKSKVSGDFYYYSPYSINNENCIIITAADCTGHGVPGGFLSMLGIAFINEILQSNSIENAADILDQLRDKVKNTLKQTGKQDEQKDGMDIALCIYYPESKRLDFAGARNPVFIVDKKGHAQTWKADRQPIGIHLKEKAFTNQSIQLSGGEMVYMFSDGIPDQFGGKGKKFMLKYMKETLVQISEQPCQEQKYVIEDLMANWMHISPGRFYDQTDDMLLVGFRVME